MIELMDAVAKLQATASEHADLLESMAAHAVATSAELTALSGQMTHTSRRMGDISERVGNISERMNDISHRMDDVSQRMDDVSQRMDQMSQRVGALEAESQTQAENFVRSANLQRTTRDQLGHLARLISDFAGTSNSRFEDIEGRLVKLERKVG